MISPVISTWIVSIVGWIVLVAGGLAGLLWALDRATRLLGLVGWMYATYQQVRKNHKWVDQNCPWWWHWITGGRREV